MPQRLLTLRPAGETSRAARNRLALPLDDLRFTDRAALRQLYLRSILRGVFDDPYNFWNHIARAPHNDSVALTNILPSYLVDIVQSAVADSHSTHEDGL